MFINVYTHVSLVAGGCASFLVLVLQLALACLSALDTDVANHFTCFFIMFWAVGDENGYSLNLGSKNELSATTLFISTLLNLVRSPS